MEVEYVNQMEKEHSKSSSTCAYQTWGSRGTECACEVLGKMTAPFIWSHSVYSLHVKPHSIM
jgi:hypothetical protein